jgi:signal recognition particle subunit SRP68
MASA